MKTFLGFTTGLLTGTVLGIAAITVLCLDDEKFMRFFSETCGYEYEPRPQENET